MLSWISGNSTREAEIPSRPSSLCGFLWKMKRQRKLLVPQWNKRWFSIEGRYLRWYRIALDDEPSGSIDLKKVSYITRFQMEGAYSFIIGYPDRNLMIRAESLVEMDKWIRALQLQADVARGGTGMNLIHSNSSLTRSSPSGKNRGLKKKAYHTLEAQLDRSLRQLEDLERKILRGDEISLDLSQQSIDSVPNFEENSLKSQQTAILNIAQSHKKSQPIGQPVMKHPRAYQASESESSLDDSYDNINSHKNNKENKDNMIDIKKSLKGHVDIHDNDSMSDSLEDVMERPIRKVKPKNVMNDTSKFDEKEEDEMMLLLRRNSNRTSSNNNSQPNSMRRRVSTPPPKLIVETFVDSDKEQNDINIRKVTRQSSTSMSRKPSHRDEISSHSTNTTNTTVSAWSTP